VPQAGQDSAEPAIANHRMDADVLKREREPLKREPRSSSNDA
jgi:hypothetical protein